MTFELRDDGRVLVSLIVEAHEDPAFGTSLELLDKDVDAGRNVDDIPEDLAKVLTEAGERTAPGDEPIIGDVEL